MESPSPIRASYPPRVENKSLTLDFPVTWNGVAVACHRALVADTSPKRLNYGCMPRPCTVQPITPQCVVKPLNGKGCPNIPSRHTTTHRRHNNSYGCPLCKVSPVVGLITPLPCRHLVLPPRAGLILAMQRYNAHCWRHNTVFYTALNSVLSPLDSRLVFYNLHLIA